MPTNNYSATNTNGVNYSLVYTAGSVIPPVIAHYTLTITYPGGATSTVSNITPANVLTANGSLTAVSLLGTSSFVIPPGITGTINLVANVLGTTNVYVGGTATIAALADVGGSTTINVDGGSATFANNIVASALSGSTVNLDHGGTFGNGLGLLTALSGTNIDFGTGGGTFVASAGGSLLNLSSTSINDITTNSDVIDDKTLGFAAGIKTYTVSGTGAQLVTITSNDGSSFSFTTSGSNLAVGTFGVLPGGPLRFSSDGSGGTDISICYLAGTLIRTEDGETAVECIQVGDRVVALVDGQQALREVVWVGSRHVIVQPGRHPDEAGYAVRVLKGAIAEGLPNKDLLITPEHSLFFDGRLIPVRMLVNGRSIFYDRSITSYDYFHIETAPHAIIYADGVPSETYLDTGNRRGFAQSGTVVRLPVPVRTWAEDAAAPLDVRRETVEPLWRSLAERAARLDLGTEGTQAVLVAEPDLRLLTERGVEIRPILRDGGTHSFVVPGGTRALRLLSRASRPADTVGPFVDERRELGVLVGGITIRDGRRTEAVQAHRAGNTLSGWHAPEESSAFRWTSGDAILPLDLEVWGGRPVVLAIEVVQAGPYLAATPAASPAERLVA